MAWFHKKKQTSDHKNSPVPDTENEELVAVLAAAVAAYMGTAPGNIAVRSWRQVSPAWRRSAREMLIFHR